MEFLTPEDASAALSFDGMFYSGSNLKLRRPKDYADVNVRIISMMISVLTVSLVNILIFDTVSLWLMFLSVCHKLSII